MMNHSKKSKHHAIHRRFTASMVRTPNPSNRLRIIFRNQSLSACEARLLFRASRTTCGHSHGRKAANQANRPSRNCPLESTKRSVDGKLEIEFVRNHFHDRESHSSHLCGARHRSRFHVDGLRSKRISQTSPSAPDSQPIRNSPALLPRDPDSRCCRRPHSPLAAAARCPHFQRRIERSGKAHRINHASARTTRSPPPPPAAPPLLQFRRKPEPHRPSRKTESAVRVHPSRSTRHSFDQRTHLALQRGHDRNSRHIRCPGTTPPPAATRPSTGTIFHPSSRSALAELANIFFLPMRTVSTVARGSPLQQPVR